MPNYFFLLYYNIHLFQKFDGKFDFLNEEGVEVVYLPRTPEISSSQIRYDLYDAASVEKSCVDNSERNTNPKR